jgi:hypothetical protein
MVADTHSRRRAGRAGDLPMTASSRDYIEVLTIVHYWHSLALFRRVIQMLQALCEYIAGILQQILQLDHSHCFRICGNAASKSHFIRDLFGVKMSSGISE